MNFRIWGAWRIHMGNSSQFHRKHMIPMTLVLFKMTSVMMSHQSMLDQFMTYIWVNYYSSLTWIKAIWGWFPLLSMIPVRENSEVVIIYPDIYHWHMGYPKKKSKHGILSWRTSKGRLKASPTTCRNQWMMFWSPNIYGKKEKICSKPPTSIYIYIYGQRSPQDRKFYIYEGR